VGRFCGHVGGVHDRACIVVLGVFGIFLDEYAAVGAVVFRHCIVAVYRSGMANGRGWFGGGCACCGDAIYALAISLKINLPCRLSFWFFRGKVESQRGAMVAPVKTGARSYYVRYPGLPV
jgi:hypothetical protein